MYFFTKGTHMVLKWNTQYTCALGHVVYHLCIVRVLMHEHHSEAGCGQVSFLSVLKSDVTPVSILLIQQQHHLTGTDTQLFITVCAVVCCHNHLTHTKNIFCVYYQLCSLNHCIWCCSSNEKMCYHFSLVLEYHSPPTNWKIESFRYNICKFNRNYLKSEQENMTNLEATEQWWTPQTLHGSVCRFAAWWSQTAHKLQEELRHFIQNHCCC